MKRRAFLSTLGALPLFEGLVPVTRKRPHVVVVGAGGFGGWTALYLLRRGAPGTLLDAPGPRNARARPGGETPVNRAPYRAPRIYTHLAARPPPVLKAHQRR